MRIFLFLIIVMAHVRLHVQTRLQTLAYIWHSVVPDIRHKKTAYPSHRFFILHHITVRSIYRRQAMLPHRVPQKSMLQYRVPT